MSHHVKYDDYRSVKRSLRFHRTNTVVKKSGFSLKTVLQIRGSKTYDEYQQNNKAQHPPQTYSLREEVIYAHKLLFDKGDNKYIAPDTAKQAITEVIKELK